MSPPTGPLPDIGGPDLLAVFVGINPGIRSAQAHRLWALEREVCDRLLTELVTEGFLARSRDGAFPRRNRSSVR